MLKAQSQVPFYVIPPQIGIKQDLGGLTQLQDLGGISQLQETKAGFVFP